MFDPDELTIQTRDGATRLKVRVKPRASRSAILGVREEALVVALAAPPVDGEANQELIRFLAACVGISKASVTLTSGAASRIKLLDFTGIDAAQLRARLAASAQRTGRK